jgi:hypothetical protein
MAELADALALGASGRKAVQVQVLFSAPFKPVNLSHLSDCTLQQRRGWVYVFLRNHNAAVPCQPLDFKKHQTPLSPQGACKMCGACYVPTQSSGSFIASRRVLNCSLAQWRDN